VDVILDLGGYYAPSATGMTISRAFYDGLGRLVETRTFAPGNQDVVSYRSYDTSGRLAFQSAPYFVAAYGGLPGYSAYAAPDASQPGKTYTYDGLGRLISTKNALSNQTTYTMSVACGTISGDSACYEQTVTIDANNHQRGALVDALGRAVYEQRFTGNSSGTYAAYATAKYQYDYNGKLVRITHPDNSTITTFTYDMASRQTAVADPDSGSTSYTYDQDGNVTRSIDGRGAAGTVYAGYDGIDRVIWRNTTNGPSGAFTTYTYDISATNPVGRLTSETFTGGPNNSLSGSYSYNYDSRGRRTGATLTIAGTNYPVSTTFDDADNTLTQTYPTGEVVTNTYSGDWLTGVTTTQGNTTLLSNASYAFSPTSGQFGGPAHLLTGASLGGGLYQFSAGYDALQRATDLKVTNGAGSTVYFEQARAFDPAGNVTSANTTLPFGTDKQAFCYDEQSRLTWAGSIGTPPCQSLSPGSLYGSQYTQTFAYDSLGRLTASTASGSFPPPPNGSYSYGDPAHVHAATAIGPPGWTAAYDAAGNMCARALGAGASCGGTGSGAQLSYDPAGRLAAWQDTPSNPTYTAGFLYDGQGNRVEAQTTSSGSTTTTVYVGSLEQVATGASTTTTSYYYAGATRIAAAVSGTISYLASDALRSADLALTNGNAPSGKLYGPYGLYRYTQADMPTDYGFIGQHADITGLDYFNARYYDPSAGQFTSADPILPGGGLDVLGLSRYAYVEGNPVARTDPSGYKLVCEGCGSVSYQLCYDSGNAECGTALYWKNRSALSTPAAVARIAYRLYFQSDNFFASRLTDAQTRELFIASGMGEVGPEARKLINDDQTFLSLTLVAAGVILAGRRGGPSTRSQLERVRDQFLDANPDWRHVAGGRSRASGAELPEEYLPGPGRGTSWPDLTFESPDGMRIRINTVDVDASGRMTPREY
jgi:RHS repeat-associated protein